MMVVLVHMILIKILTDVNFLSQWLLRPNEGKVAEMFLDDFYHHMNQFDILKIFLGFVVSIWRSTLVIHILPPIAEATKKLDLGPDDVEVWNDPGRNPKHRAACSVSVLCQSSTRDGSGLQNGSIFGKIPNGLWPHLIFAKSLYKLFSENVRKSPIIKVHNLQHKF